MKHVYAALRVKWHAAQEWREVDGVRSRRTLVACVVDGSSVEVADTTALTIPADSDVTGFYAATYIARLHNDALAAGVAEELASKWHEAAPFPQPE